MCIENQKILNNKSIILVNNPTVIQTNNTNLGPKDMLVPGEKTAMGTEYSSHIIALL